MKPCSVWKLYVIIDPSAAGSRSLAEVAAAAIRGGADVVQLRDKSASTRQLMAEAAQLLPVTRAAGIPLIINDRVDVARSVGADGVHLGQDDVPITEARGMLGEGRLIGTSTHGVEQALAAEAEGADYIGLGPIFPTPTKPAYGSIGLHVITEVAPRIRIPVVCIGGIDCKNLPQVLAAGAERIAVVRAVCAAEDPEQAARDLKHTLAQFVPTIPLPNL